MNNHSNCRKALRQLALSLFPGNRLAIFAGWCIYPELAEGFARHTNRKTLLSRPFIRISVHQ